MQVFTFIISIILKLPRHKKEVCIAHRGIDKNTYSRAVTHSWAFWDDQPVEGECEKDHDDGHGEQEREDESGKLNFFFSFFWRGGHIFIRCCFQANPLTVYLRMEEGAIRHEVA